MSTKTKGDILAETVEAFLKPYGVPVSDLRKALADYRKPWTLGRSVNGFTLGEGQEWTGEDWKESDLPEGWRPALVGEKYFKGADQIEMTDWEPCNHSALVDDKLAKIRTRRPLPPVIDPYAELKDAFKDGKQIQLLCANGEWLNVCPDWSASVEKYRIKPEPKLVPLGPEDVKCGDIIEQGDLELIIAGKNKKEVKTAIGSYSYEQLQIAWKINRNDGRGFVRCEKEAK